jgi:hypothetical protein
MLLAPDVIVIDERRVLLVVVMVVGRRSRRARLDMTRLERPGTGLAGRRAVIVVLVLLGHRRDLGIGDKLVPRVDGVRVLGRGLQRLEIGQSGLRRLSMLVRRQQLRVLVRRSLRRLCRRHFLARRPENLRLLAPDFVVAGAMGALQLEVLSYRVVEDPHAGPD